MLGAELFPSAPRAARRRGRSVDAAGGEQEEGLTTANCVANATNPIKQQWDPRFIMNSDSGGPVTPVTGVARNFYFTSEIRYLFRHAGGETLTFFRDDDVWVYINGLLALDLGAPHEWRRSSKSAG